MKTSAVECLYDIENSIVFTDTVLLRRDSTRYVNRRLNALFLFFNFASKMAEDVLEERQKNSLPLFLPYAAVFLVELSSLLQSAQEAGDASLF